MGVSNDMAGASYTMHADELFVIGVAVAKSPQRFLPPKRATRIEKHSIQKLIHIYKHINEWPPRFLNHMTTPSPQKQIKKRMNFFFFKIKNWCFS